MPLAHNLNKVTKNLSKSTGSIHIKGRKFKQLNRATVRDKKLQKQKLNSIEKKSNELLIVTFIQNKIKDEPNESYSLEEIKDLINDFINIDRERLKDAEKEHRKGRPISTKQKLLSEKVKHEEHVFETGYKVPDISDPETVTRLRSWNGTTGATTGFKFTHVSKSQKSFPTKEVEMR
ncbi:TMA16 [Candida pseudojiufengensis]|uniref:TMA16 n=1 Tax=Candida pseudojiufengensis TaxID=497109 RepID=UPI002224A30F|nr:TMA16 [Candida pseudojiufengensis]KAI5964811.1 TMA16 [Candida pseudojiufengensis]